MTQSGADLTIISNGFHAAIMENRPIDTAKLISAVHDVDIIITEGYKHGSWPKILVHRRAVGKEPAVDPDTCFAIITDQHLTDNVPEFSLDDAECVASAICRDSNL